MCLRSFFLNVFFLPFFSGAAGPPAAAGFAISEFSVLGSQFSVVARFTSTTENWELRTGFLCFRSRLLLIRDRSLTRSLAGTRVGMRALSANRQVAAVTVSAVGADFDEPLDVHRNFFAQIAFHHAFGLDDLADAVDLVFAEVLNLLVPVHVRLLQNTGRARIANAVNVSERDHRMFVAWKIDSCNACHIASNLQGTPALSCELPAASFEQSGSIRLLRARGS